MRCCKRRSRSWGAEGTERIGARYGRLCLVGAPDVLGSLRGQVEEPVQHTLEAELPASVADWSVPEIERYIAHKVNLH